MRTDRRVKQAAPPRRLVVLLAEPGYDRAVIPHRAHEISGHAANMAACRDGVGVLATTLLTGGASRGGDRSDRSAAADSGGKAKKKGNAAKSGTRTKTKTGATPKTANSKKDKVVAAKPAPIPPPKGKVAVLAFDGDGANPLRARVVRLLRAKGLKVITSLRPVDTPEQYREMADTLALVAFLDGEASEDWRSGQRDGARAQRPYRDCASPPRRCPASGASCPRQSTKSSGLNWRQLCRASRPTRQNRRKTRTRADARDRGGHAALDNPGDPSQGDLTPPR